MRKDNERVIIFPILAAVFSGIFLAVASHSLNWSGTTLFVVGCGMVALLVLLGLPLIALTTTSCDKESPQAAPAPHHVPRTSTPLPLTPREVEAKNSGRTGYVTSP